MDEETCFASSLDAEHIDVCKYLNQDWRLKPLPLVPCKFPAPCDVRITLPEIRKTLYPIDVHGFLIGAFQAVVVVEPLKKKNNFHLNHLANH